jgi:long-chain acyl-CoA synthetase
LGDRRRFTIMLVVPNLQTLTGWAESQGIRAASTEALLALPEVQTKMDREVRTTLRDLASFEIPKKLLLLHRDFTAEAGELTPTLKIKRRVVELRYREEIEKLYKEE